MASMPRERDPEAVHRIHKRRGVAEQVAADVKVDRDESHGAEKRGKPFPETDRRRAGLPRDRLVDAKAGNCHRLHCLDLCQLL